MDDHRDVALFRYSVIRAPADPSLSLHERGELVRDLARRDHLGPTGEPVRVSRSTLDRWIRAWRGGGFDALLPRPGKRAPRTAQKLLDLAEQLKKEQPKRSAAHIAEILTEKLGAAPSERTLQRHFARLGLNRRSGTNGGRPRAFGRFEASRRNELWIGDALHGPVIAGHKTYLFAFLDDYSRAFVGYRWGLSEDSLRLEAALRRALATRGVPDAVYVDNGSAFVSRHLLRACAVLGIRLIHSAPGRPQGRGKVERVLRTVRDRFLVKLDQRGADDVDELNRLFQEWVEIVYHRRVHSETGEAPLPRFLSAGAVTLPTPGELKEAFLWSEQRRVTKTATVSLFGNTYEVDAALVGATVELIFDPFELSDIDVRYQGRALGKAVVHRISRHVHPEAKRELDPAPAPTTGIDYLALIEARFAQETKKQIDYRELPDDQEERP